jgi:phosphate starvation-inducible PhoH-like protein
LNTPATRSLSFEPIDNIRLANFVGPMDDHLRQVEQRLGVEIHRRGGQLDIRGEESAVTSAARALNQMYNAARNEELTPERVHLTMQEAGMDPAPVAVAADAEASIHTLRGGIRGRGANQKQYLQSIRNSDLSFGIGPAGTGKTYLAVASAVEALQNDRVRSLVSERLGFLPGDISQKVDPYLRPMYDALYEMMGYDRVARAIERNVIEVAPLAFMRGRSLNDSFVILDEAQNTSVEQMKMFLTRIGFGSKAVVTGDITQIDLPKHQTSGLKHVIDILDGVEGVSFTFFNSRDVVRHPLVQRIVQAYERRQASIEAASANAKDRDRT